MRWLFLLLLCPFYVEGQIIPKFGSPRPATLTQKGLPQELIMMDKTEKELKRRLNVHSQSYHNSGLTIQQQNQLMIQRDMKMVYEQEKRKREALKDAHNSLNGASEYPTVIHYEFPSHSHIETTTHYRTAFKELNEMLTDSTKMSLKRAVYLVENAYYQNTMPPFEKFEEAIKSRANFCHKRLVQDGLQNNDIAKKWVLHQFMCDTLEVKEPALEKTVYHFPFQYDFDDYMGKKDWSKMFIIKLLTSRSGQCHSMPLLYLLLAEELGIDAHLAFSPNHSYVMFQDEKKDWYNLELTSGQYISNTAIIESGYISTEAIKNGIYMRPLSKKETIAQCIVDLAHGYIFKYGYDSFAREMLYKVLEHDPTSISANMTLANYYTAQLDYVAAQLNYPNKESLSKDLQVSQILRKRNTYYKKVDELGYVPMPEEKYNTWLKAMMKAKEKQEDQLINVPLR